MSALEGIRVIDLSRVLAGPFCGQMLADQGAEVIKVEAPEGDMNRAFPMVLGPGESTNYLSANRGKRGMTLNLKVPEARELLYRLAERADVLIQSFLPKTAGRLGVDYETFAGINPDLIYTSVSGYGPEGPLADKPGFDMMVAAYSGLIDLTGEPGRPPVRMGVPAVDVATGMLAYGATVTALFARSRGGARGQRIDVSLLQSAINLLSFHATNYTAAGVVDRREGLGYGNLAPYDAYGTADGEILVGVATEMQWDRLCRVLDSPEVAADPRFATNPDRCANREVLRDVLEGILAKAPGHVWLERFEEAGLPCAPINSVDRAMNDPQVRANGLVAAAPRADGTSVDLVGLPFRLSETPGATGAAPPACGQHTDEILADWLGLGPAETAALRDAGAL